MISFFVLLLIAIGLTEIVWKFLPQYTKQVYYVWIAAGGGWSALLSRRMLTENPGFSWQEILIAFVSVLIFMTLHAGYARLRGRKA